MGKKDKAEKLFVACPDVFAELVNGLMYGGAQVLKAGQLVPASTESLYYNSEQTLHGQFRDFAMYVMQDGCICALYALESQSTVDNRMPLRQAGYDGAAYRNQYRVKGNQGIYPVVTLVLNWGLRPWDGALRVRELLDYALPASAEEYLDQNRIHVFDMRFLDAEIRMRFQGDVRIVLDYLSDRESLLERNQNPKNPEEVMQMLHALTGDDRYLEHILNMKEEQSGMCDLLEAMVNKGKEEGMKEGIKEGMKEGIKEGMKEGMRLFILTCKDLGLGYEDIAGRLKEGFHLEEDEVLEEMALCFFGPRSGL